MTRTIFTLYFTLFVSFVFAQNFTVPKKSSCTHCNMTVQNQKFAALVVKKNGETQYFDAIECLVNFLKVHEETSYETLKVANFERDNVWVEAKSAIFLKSQEIASPMGAYLSAYASLAQAKKVQKAFGGEIFDWSTLKLKFKDSSFGLLDHPTHHHDRPDAFAPIGIMGDHLHHMGGMMIKVKYMSMRMKGNISGSSGIDDNTLFQKYLVAPQSMHMEMLMISAMYAPSEKLTLMLMQNLISKEMALKTRMGLGFNTNSQGLGDLKLTALYGIISKSNASLHLNTGLSIPTGSITNTDNTPMADNIRLPYPMQLGSGTFDFILGTTYKGSSTAISWGIQPSITVRSGKNKEGYQWGNDYIINSWVAYSISKWVSIATQFNGNIQSSMNGIDTELNPNMVSTADAKNTGFTKVYGAVGLNFSLGERSLMRNIKAGISYSLPLYQKVKGYQMQDQSNLTLGLRYAI